MTETIANFLVELFQGTIPKELIIFIISMFPIVELRGGMIAAKLLDIELLRAFIICYIGNIIPIPFSSSKDFLLQEKLLKSLNQAHCERVKR